jgi:integrase
MLVGPTLKRLIGLTQGLRKPFSNRESNVHLKIIFGPGLAKIDQKGNCHLGRHTFGFLCASNKLPKSVTAELMGISVQTVEVYYHLSGENITQQAAILGKL